MTRPLINNGTKTAVRTTLRKWTHVLPHPHNRRDIFCACPNRLMAEYIGRVWETVNDDPRLQFYMGLKYPEYKPGENQRIREQFPIKEISVRWAKIRRWDLVIIADHGFYELAVPSRHPVIFTAHGMTGKLSSGQTEDYAYGPKAFDSNGHIRYTRMFEASEENRRQILSVRPELKDVVTVVGSPSDDRLLCAQKRRREFRQRIGACADDVVVFIISTWGPHSLLHTKGDAILHEVRRLTKQGGYKFVISAHPHDYHIRMPDGRVWEWYLRDQQRYGIFVREPHEDWAPWMVGCDVLLTDHTSLCTTGAIIGKPCIFVPIPHDVLRAGSVISRLRDISPQLDDVSRLEDIISNIRMQYPYDKLRQLARDINSCPGESRRRIRNEIYKLLNLSPRPEPQHLHPVMSTSSAMSQFARKAYRITQKSSTKT